MAQPACMYFYMSQQNMGRARDVLQKDLVVEELFASSLNVKNNFLYANFAFIS